MARYSATCYGMTTPYEVMPLITPSPHTPLRDAPRATTDGDDDPVTVEPGAPAGIGNDRDTTIRFVAGRRTPLAGAAEALSGGAAPVLAGGLPGDLARI